ncbi:MAG: indolepyruvate oxidoreductase subunit beta [Oscillospiraceae bacterium]|jgi:indolepyruvate ferredoxin oxidoreductase beta subunit|nr:indolepyruvate oxidoreductase subunit beta [Oscillospiraceae bacterium]
MYNIMIAGVGGQGTLLASRVLGAVFLSQGLEVKVSEVHGMSQRGGSVVTYVRAGESVSSPIVAEGTADLLLAFEELEALRWAHFLKKDGVLAVSTQKILPMPVITGAAEYPENILQKLMDSGVKTIAVDASDIAVRAGTSRASNVALMGAASTIMDIPYEVWKEALAQNVPPRFTDVNIKAFDLGRQAGESKV